MRSDRELQSEHLTARQQQAQARREQIIEAAVQLFARQGFDATSTKQIARAVGITEGLIFHYFPTKADLLNATLETRHAFLIELRSCWLRLKVNLSRQYCYASLSAGWSC